MYFISNFSAKWIILLLRYGITVGPRNAKRNGHFRSREVWRAPGNKYMSVKLEINHFTFTSSVFRIPLTETTSTVASYYPYIAYECKCSLFLAEWGEGRSDLIRNCAGSGWFAARRLSSFSHGRVQNPTAPPIVSLSQILFSLTLCSCCSYEKDDREIRIKQALTFRHIWDKINH